MRMLVATQETQGKRRNDFCHVEEGEPVTFTLECDGEKVDGKCGCKRAMTGVVGRNHTTTFKVVESDMLPEDLHLMLKEGWQKAWRIEEVDADSYARDDLAELTRIAAYFPVGTVLEKRGKNFQARVGGAE